MTPRSRVARLLALPATVVLVVGLAAGCTGDDDAPDRAAPTAAAQAEQSEQPSSGLTVADDGTEVSYAGVAGKTALELLQELDPQAFTSGEGENAYVTTIGGREADSSANEFWAFYVDGEQAQVGAGSYELTGSEIVTWKLETF